MFDKKIIEKTESIFARIFFAPTSLQGRMVKLCSREQQMNNSIQYLEFLRSSTLLIQLSFPPLSPGRDWYRQILVETYFLQANVKQ